MKANLSRVMGCVILAALAPCLALAQSTLGSGPRNIWYQGLLLDVNNNPILGTHTFRVDYFTTPSGGTPIYSDTDFHDILNKGSFELPLGGTYGFPAKLTFAEPYWFQLTLDKGSPSEQIFPRTPLLSAPYALNSERANGLPVYDHPVNGALWPVPLDGSGKIDAAILPAPTVAVQTIQNVAPDINGNVALVGTNGVTITPNTSTHTITISGPSNVIVPVGTTAQRPVTPVQGMIRYNTDSAKFEAYDGTGWQNLN